MVLSALKRFSDYVSYCYFYYCLIFTISMLEPVERYVFNAFFIVFVSLLVYTMVVYLPGNVMMLLDFLLHISGISPYADEEATVDRVQS